MNGSKRAIVPFDFSAERDPLPGVQAPLNALSSFTILSGRPGSGKTTALLNLLMRKQHYGGKFDAVYIISPSFGSVDPSLLASIPKDQVFNELNPETLNEILAQIYAKHQGKKVLLVLDDVVNDLAHNATQRSLQKLLFNRRHLTSKDPDAKRGGFVSVIMTTQVLNRIPLMLRKMSNSVWLWPTRSQPEIRSIRDELVPTSKEAFKAVVDRVWMGQHDPLIVDVDGGHFWHIDQAGKFARIVSPEEYENNNSGVAPVTTEPAEADADHTQSYDDLLSDVYHGVINRYKQMYN